MLRSLLQVLFRGQDPRRVRRRLIAVELLMGTVILGCILLWIWNVLIK